ncbi:11105_t:CDS:2, partial [Funneliformis geosporum]
ALDGKNHHLKIALKNKEEEIKERINFTAQFRDKLRDKDYSIYSLTEQKNKLFAEVEQLQAELKATQEELEINRQSVLKIETENEKGQIITRFITVADYYQLEEENLTLQHNYEKLERMKKRRSTSSLSSSSGKNSQPNSPQLDNSTRLSELEKINEELNEEIRELHQQFNSFREEKAPAPVITPKVK